MLLLLLSLIAGILTVLAPCTLPLLPVILGSSLSGTFEKRKVFTIAISLGLSILLFTMLLKVSSVFINIPEEVWAIISGCIIILFGIISLFPLLWESLSFTNTLNIEGNKLIGEGYRKNSFWGDVLIGASLGPVFSSCSPTYFLILATVLPQSLGLGLLDLFVYALGLSGSLIVIVFLGQKIIDHLGSISDTHGRWRRGLGAVFILVGVMVVFGIDKKIEYSLLSNGLFDITRVEQILLKHSVPTRATSEAIVTSRLNSNSASSTITTRTQAPIQKSHGPKAPEIINPSGFINTDGKPITIGQFKGKKVVLLDIWTYSCINCQRTLPYVKEWYEKYKDQGLVVIGLHTPEFSFEKVQANVVDAVKKLGITYPVVMDNDYSTWNAFGNQYWPRKYLISGDGEIIYDHIGEGGYDETELAIREALYELNGEKAEAPISEPKDTVPVDPSEVQSPETYFGGKRNEYLGNGREGTLGLQDFSVPASLYPNLAYFSGTWDIEEEYAVNKTKAKIIYTYSAKNVYMVASSESGITVTILKDGKKIKDLYIKANELYTLIEGKDYGEHTLEIDIPQAGLNAFTFTFG